MLKTSPTRPRLRPRTVRNYCFTMRNNSDKEKLKNRLEGGDKEEIEAEVQRLWIGYH